MEEQSFKEYCKKAKGRFKNGYWTNFSKIKQQKLTEALNEGKSEEEVKRTLTRLAQSEVKRDIFGASSDDELYKKVVEILSSSEVVLNPISRLIDEAYYNTLSDSERQGYVLNLGKKFEELRNRYYLEKEA